ncbi:hypothetical protein ACFL6U_00555 [Planctomycetota bacterium]
MVHYRFPARQNKPPVKLIWYSGLLPLRPEEMEPGQDFVGKKDGILFIGDKGKMMCGGFGSSPRLIPLTKTREYKKPPKTLPRSKGHYRDWIDACRGGPQASASFDFGGRLTEIVLAGTVAMRTGQKLEWDGQQMKATNCPEADQYIRPDYCNSWKQ